ncbi:unnamed protein product [Amoebophrya sp. A25]|nr:unnamed protein product [Amoebophrya sp. A25]|eukprot:GSA25T00025704001.1
MGLPLLADDFNAWQSVYQNEEATKGFRGLIKIEQEVFETDVWRSYKAKAKGNMKCYVVAFFDGTKDTSLPPESKAIAFMLVSFVRDTGADARRGDWIFKARALLFLDDGQGHS